MPPIRECEVHGYVAGDGCPACSNVGTLVLGSDRRTRLSKFLSGALRHFPDDAGLSLDDQGWAPYDELVDAAAGKYDWVRPEHVAAVIATDPKGRFEWDVARSSETDSSGADPDLDLRGGRVRAAYGHSVDVDLDAEETPVPDVLYHGTAPENLGSIREEGLRPMGRQKVHLSGTVDEALNVGKRHSDDPVVLEIDAATMQADGERIVKRGRRIYTTDRVPPEYLQVLEE